MTLRLLKKNKLETLQVVEQISVDYINGLS